MALRNKLDDTKLRSLTYGDNAPYVTVDITTQNVNAKVGGKLAVKNNDNRINRAIIDTARISSFLVDITLFTVR